MRNPEPRLEKICFFICENEYVDQLCGNPATGQHLCFRYKISTIP